MKVTLIAAISADGKIAEHVDQSSMDWTSKEDKQFFIDKTKEIGVVVMGRKTFSTFNRALKGRRLLVLTKDPSKEKPMPGVEFSNLEPHELVAKLESEGVTDLAVAGGASIYGQFLAAGLVTEVFLTLEPILFGGGVPLAQGFARVALRFQSVKQLNSHTLLLHYLV
ncbi:MAG: dihydrofolate reductase family protein [Patescibacteria group bacterium]